MFLDATTKSIQAVLSAAITTNNWSIIDGYIDYTIATPTLTPYTGTILTNGVTAVTIVPAPGSASIQRQVKDIAIHNDDTVSGTITIKLNNNGTLYIIKTATLNPNDTLTYTYEQGWSVTDANGGIRTSTILSSTSFVTRTVLTAASGTYTTPNGCTAINVRAWGGGGAGGGAATNSGTNATVGCGGQAGGYAEKLIVSPASSYAYVCGTGGTGSSGTTGGAGNDTTFNVTTVVSKGGAGGNTMASGSTVSTVGCTIVTALGTGDIASPGQRPVACTRFSGTFASSSAGASSLVGVGGDGVVTQSDGGAATVGYASGGGGACSYNASAQTGGNGSAGIIIVDEYYGSTVTSSSLATIRQAEFLGG